VKSTMSRRSRREATGSTRTAGIWMPPWLSSRKELLMVALLTLLGALLLIGSSTMAVLGDSLPGPQFVPVIVGVLVLLTAGALAIDVLRSPEAPHGVEDERFGGNFSADMLHDVSGLPEPGSPGAPTAVTGAVAVDDVTAAIDAADREKAGAPAAPAPRSDLRTLGLVLASTIGFVLVLEHLGWVLSAAALFWCVSRLLGSRRPILDIGIALLVSSVVQLIFGGLLGLSLPAFLSGGSL
jgi:putative tricarboxylic transport membrane protein